MYSISELLNSYMTEKRLKKSTCDSYGVASRALIRRFGDCLAEEIDRAAVIQWRIEVLDNTLKAVSWNTYMRQLRILYQFGLQAGLMGPMGNPFENTQVRCLKRPNKTVKKETIKFARGYLDILQKQEDEWHQMSEIHPAWFWRTVFETLVYTGIRANELLHLRMCDIDLHEGLLRVAAEFSKNYHERKIPIHENLEPYLRQLVFNARKKHVSPEQQLFNVNIFSSRHSRDEMDMNQLSTFFKRLSQQTPERISSHRLRHTIATELMRDPDRNIHTVKNIMGHQNIATTMKYVAVNHAQMRDLINTIV